MTRILALALVVCSASALAQEIGKEIPADQQQNATPPSDQTPNYDNPYATPPPPPPTPTKKDDAAAADADGVAGPRKGAFGLRASFGGGGIPAASLGGTVALGAGSPSVGLRYFASDALAADIDVGFVTQFANTMSLGFGAGLGINYYLGRRELPVRPFAHGGFGFGRLTGPLGSTDAWNVNFNVGGGGEYWFSDYFSVNVRALLGLPVVLVGSTTVVSIATFTPGIGLTVYF